MRKNLFGDYVQMALDKLIRELEDEGRTPEEINEFMKGKQFGEMFRGMMKQIVQDISIDINGNIDSIDESLIQIKNEYRYSIEEKWKSLLKYLRLYHLMCCDICEGYKEYVNNEKIDSDNLMKSLVINAINSRALTVYEEIICLLENGYPEGALAHWRTLFELWMVAEFINYFKDNVAAEYFKSSIENSNDEQSKYKWARVSGRFEENKNIGINAIISESYRILQEKTTNIRSKKKFLTLYNMSNTILHPSAKGVFNRMSPSEEWFDFSIGPSKFGLDTAAVNTVTVLFNINKLHLDLFKNEVSYIGLDLLQNIINDQIFIEAERIGRALEREL